MEEKAFEAAAAAHNIVWAGTMMGVAIVYWFIKKWIGEWMEK